MSAHLGAGPMKKPPPRKIYVCSPYRATSDDEADRKQEQRDNLTRVRKACRLLLLCDCMPLAPHAYFPRFLSDDNPNERKRGMELGLQWLAESDELWVFGKRISEGMEAEIAFANEHGIPVRYMPEPEELARRWYDILKHELGGDNLSEAAPVPRSAQTTISAQESESEQLSISEQTMISAQVPETAQEGEIENGEE